jgi:pullulanase/glycogen debranching enzyme
MLAEVNDVALDISNMATRMAITRLLGTLRARPLNRLVPCKHIPSKINTLNLSFGKRHINRYFSTNSQSAMDTFAEGPIYDRAWWREIIVYQIYVHSFNDSTGNGVGDLNGIIDKLNYLQDLGVDVLWLTPVYDSPLADMGYDIRDYEKILDLYGTIDDWQRLLDELHKRRMRLIMDLVVNHTSCEVSKSFEVYIS